MCTAQTLEELEFDVGVNLPGNPVYILHHKLLS
jgi:hypothetical protein